MFNDAPVVIPDNEDVVVPQDGQQDPLDAISDPEELRKAAKANRAIAARLKGKVAKSPQTPPSPTPNPNLPDTPKQNPDEELNQRLSTLELSEKKRQVGHELGLSPEETDNLFRFAGSADPREAYKSPFFQAGLKEVRRERRVAEATPSSTNKGAKVNGKTLAEMTHEERKANWSKITGK